MSVKRSDRRRVFSRVVGCGGLRGGGFEKAAQAPGEVYRAMVWKHLRGD
jgi:hypothetical protein